VLGAVLLVVAPNLSSVHQARNTIAPHYSYPTDDIRRDPVFGWLGDAIFLGSNQPVLRWVMIMIEQVIRIILLVGLLARFQIEALVIAYFIGILVRGVVAYFVADRYCFPQKIYFWQTLFAPLLAAGLHYLFLSVIANFVWQGEEITSVILFFIALVPAMPVFFFFYALAGGWDDAGLEEIAEARELGSFRRCRDQLKKGEHLIIDDLFLRRLPASAGDELADKGLVAPQKVTHHAPIKAGIEHSIQQQVVQLAIVKSHQVERALDPRRYHAGVADRHFGAPDIGHVGQAMGRLIARHAKQRMAIRRH
jgi:hypothetical protein